MTRTEVRGDEDGSDIATSRNCLAGSWRVVIVASEKIRRATAVGPALAEEKLNGPAPSFPSGLSGTVERAVRFPEGRCVPGDFLRAVGGGLAKHRDGALDGRRGVRGDKLADPVPHFPGREVDQ